MTGLIMIQVAAIAMLAWALVPTNPYAYYMLLRVVVCALCAYLAYHSSKRSSTGWTWIFVITAILYNPILRVHLTREIWSGINIATILLLVMAIPLTRTPSTPTHQDGPA